MKVWSNNCPMDHANVQTNVWNTNACTYYTLRSHNRSRSIWTMCFHLTTMTTDTYVNLCVLTYVMYMCVCVCVHNKTTQTNVKDVCLLKRPHRYLLTMCLLESTFKTCSYKQWTHLKNVLATMTTYTYLMCLLITIVSPNNNHIDICKSCNANLNYYKI